MLLINDRVGLWQVRRRVSTNPPTAMFTRRRGSGHSYGYEREGRWARGESSLAFSVCSEDARRGGEVRRRERRAVRVREGRGGEDARGEGSEEARGEGSAGARGEGSEGARGEGSEEARGEARGVWWQGGSVRGKEGALSTASACVRSVRVRVRARVSLTCVRSSTAMAILLQPRLLRVAASVA